MSVKKVKRTSQKYSHLATDEWLCILSFLPLKDMVRGARLYKELWRAFRKNANHFTEGWVRYVPYKGNNNYLSFLTPLFLKRDVRGYLKNFRDDQCTLEEYLKYDSHFYHTLVFAPNISLGTNYGTLPIDTPMEWLLRVCNHLFREGPFVLDIDKGAIAGDLCSFTYKPPIETHLKLSEICELVTFVGTWILTDLVRQPNERIKQVNRKSGSILYLDISWLSQQEVFCRDTMHLDKSCQVKFVGTSLDQITEAPLNGICIEIANADGHASFQGCLAHGDYLMQIRIVYGTGMTNKIPSMLERLEVENVKYI